MAAGAKVRGGHYGNSRRALTLGGGDNGLDSRQLSAFYSRDVSLPCFDGKPVLSGQFLVYCLHPLSPLWPSTNDLHNLIVPAGWLIYCACGKHEALPAFFSKQRGALRPKKHPLVPFHCQIARGQRPPTTETKDLPLPTLINTRPLTLCSPHLLPPPL